MIPRGQTALPCALAKQEGRESRPARLTERRMIIISPGSELENWSPGICRNGTDNRPIPNVDRNSRREDRRSFRPRPFLFENGCWMTLKHILTRIHTDQVHPTCYVEQIRQWICRISQQIPNLFVLNMYLTCCQCIASVRYMYHKVYRCALSNASFLRSWGEGQ